VLRTRAIAIARRAQVEGAFRVVPLAVLAEVYRGDASDAGVDRLFVAGVRRAGLDLRTVRLAGRLRSRAGVGSAVDAIVVATAVRLGGGVVATSDPGDMRALAAGQSNVKVWSLDE
jgi:hypothetical protein